MPTDIVLKGRIKEEHDKRGGEAVFGLPVTEEILQVIGGQKCYGQHYEKGFIVYTSSVGARFHISPTVSSRGSSIKFVGLHNARPVHGGLGVWRFADYGDSGDRFKPLDQFILATMLKMHQVIRLNGTTDPPMPSVRNRRIKIDTPGGKATTYKSFVATSAQLDRYRSVFGWIADDNGVSGIGCTYAKDRAGWASWVLQSLWGVSYKDRLADYLLSNKDLNGGSKVAKSYIQIPHEYVLQKWGKGKTLTVPDAYRRYLRYGLGLSDAQVKRLQARKLA